MRTIRDDEPTRERDWGDGGGAEPTDVGRWRCLRATGAAILVQRVDCILEERWVPQSCVHEDSEVWRAGQEGRLVLLSWFAEEKGFV
jgi:hypothetical protein